MKPGDFPRRTENPLSSPWNLMRSISPEISFGCGLAFRGAAFIGRSHFAMGSGSRGAARTRFQLMVLISKRRSIEVT